MRLASSWGTGGNMKLCCGLMEGQFWDASFQAPVEAGTGERLVVVLSNEEILTPENADFGEFSIVEASADERRQLEQAGYSMPDWSPLQGMGCAACPTGPAEGEPRSGMSEPEN
jgi:hypothetical protein